MDLANKLLLLLSMPIFLLLFMMTVFETRRSMPPRRVGATRFVVIFTLLMAHVAEIWLFDAAFWLLLHEGGHGAIVGYENISLLDCIDFSATTYTTVGWGDVYATGNIRFLAGTEALVGFMIITWSASFGYLIMERTFGRNADY